MQLDKGLLAPIALHAHLQHSFAMHEDCAALMIFAYGVPIKGLCVAWTNCMQELTCPTRKQVDFPICGGCNDEVSRTASTEAGPSVVIYIIPIGMVNGIGLPKQAPLQPNGGNPWC